MTNIALTTTDNPYSPFTQFTEWKAYDEMMGYFTCEYLARIARTSPDLSPEDYVLAIEDAIDEIVDFNLTGNYKKVYLEEPSIAFDVVKGQEDSKNGESNTN